MHEVAILALPDVLDASLTLLLEVFEAANRVRAVAGRGPAFRVRVYGARGRSVPTGLGFTFRAHGRLADLRRLPDIVVVPGQNEVDGAALMTRVRARDAGPVLELLRRAQRAGALVTAGCTGTFYLAQAGLLSRRAATTTWFLASHFRAHYPDVELRPDATLVRDGGTWTAGAALSIVDLALALVWHVAGGNVEREVVRFLALERHPTQARYILAAHLAADVPEVARAEAWARAHLSGPLSVADLARAARTSPRTFARLTARALGCSPMGLLRRVRAEEAVHLLETTHLSLDEVSLRVGYQDASTLRRVLSREMRLGAREIRARQKAVLVTRGAGGSGARRRTAP